MTALSRKDIIRSSVDNFGAVIVCSDMSQAIEFANELAPEHLEVCCENPMEYVGKLDNAGSVFLGNYSPEPLGDYFAGPNHVLPTSGTARFFSPLSVDSFVKEIKLYLLYGRRFEKRCRRCSSLLQKQKDLQHTQIQLKCVLI